MAGRTMRAVQYDRYGGGAAGLKHVEIPIPTPQKNEVLVKVEAASLNPVDWKIQKGLLRPFAPQKFPCVPVGDIAGEICNVGPGVEDFKEGDKVIAMLSSTKGGGLAEFSVADANMTAKRPLELPAAEGSCLGIAALTALQALKSTGAKFDGTATAKPANVLITAASGGVGHYAVQLAKLGNLHVTATCGVRNLELVKSLGADEVLDYKTPEGDNLKSPSDKKYDHVLHCAAGTPWSKFEPNLSENGRVIDLTPSPRAILTCAIKKLTFSKKQLVPFLVSTKLEELKFLIELSKGGKIRTLIDSRYPLSRAEEAWAKSIEGHATGKVVVQVTEDK